MAINNLYISHAKYNFDSQLSKLLDCKNCQKSIDSIVVADYHTSISDISAKNISLAIRNSKKIVIYEIDFTDFTFISGRLLNEITISNVDVEFVNCKTIEVSTINKLNQVRANSEQVLWLFGCSITNGYGVSDAEAYGTILAKKLNLPALNLSVGGSSILYSADQILRSDIRADDIVVWGITSICRIEICDNLDFSPLPIKQYVKIDKSLQYWNLDYFGSSIQSLIHVRMILQVINFCKKIGAKLYLANMFDVLWIPVVFGGYDNFINFATNVDPDSPFIPSFIDYGNDQLHPGPKQHQYYAEKIFNLIEGNKHGKTI
jgi:hypothetical protein